MLQVDVYTVETLQLLAPGISSKDRTTVKGLVYSGEVFSEFTSSERQSIWRQMKKTKYIIPSLQTFFKDLWYLDSCANCMKRLVTPTRSSPTIKSAMRAAFLSFDPANTQSLIQTSETAFRHYPHSQADPAELGYRQLWLFAMRHYPKLSKKRQKKDHVAKPNREVDQMILYDMAVLAGRLGFKSPQIEELIQQSPDREIARDALLMARRPDCFRYDGREFESLVDRVTECFLRAIPLDHQRPAQYVGGRETKKESRCGHPQGKAQLQDRQFLFIDQIHSDIHSDFPSAQRICSFSVRRGVYFTFFGKLSIPCTINDTESSNRNLPMSPLFVPNNPPPQDERVGEESYFGNARNRQVDSSERQRRKDARRERRQQRRDKRRRKRQQRERQTSHAERHSRSYGNLSTPTPAPDMEIAHIGSMETSGSEDNLEPTIESNVASSSGGNERTDGELVLYDPELDMTEKPERVPSVEEHMVSEEERSGFSPTELEWEQVQGETGEGAAPEESLADVNMEEHASNKERVAPEAPVQLSPEEEVEDIPATVEGTKSGSPAGSPGPSRLTNKKGATLREKAKWRPYDRAQRQRELVSKLSEPRPQETAIQEQSRRVTQIDFTEAQLRLQPETNEGRSPRLETRQNDEVVSRQISREMSPSTSTKADHPSQVRDLDGSDVTKVPDGVTAAAANLTALASQDAQTPDQRESPSRVSAGAVDSSEVDVEKQLDIPRPIDQHSRRHGMIITRPESQDRSPESMPGVTITFRARDKNGEWNHVVHQMVVDPSDPSPVERMAAKNARERQATFYDQNLRQIPIGQCFDAAIEEGMNTLFVTFGSDLVLCEETMESIERALRSDSSHDRPAKGRL